MEHTIFLNPNQHGFRSQILCPTQLLANYDEVLTGLKEGQIKTPINLNFSKAFDEVDKGIFCHKMGQIGIYGKLEVWLHNFLTNRKQVVTANG